MKKIKRFLEFMKEEKGIGVVEVILILVVLIGLVIIFKITTDKFGRVYFLKRLQVKAVGYKVGG